MFGMDNALFSEILPDVKKELEDASYLDDKVLVSETTINVLNEYTRDNEIKQGLLSTDIKLELPVCNIYGEIKVKYDVADDIQIKFNNKQLFCNNCNEYYEEYCTKCGMLVCILNGNALNDEATKEIPTDILEIKEGLFGHTGIFALKTIPKGVKFGPFTGFGTAESSWRLKWGKFVVSSDKSELLNWMQHVNFASSSSDQNLYAFQYEDNLYYSSVCEIQEGEELLVYLGEEYEESLSKNVEMDFTPHIETDTKNVFACTYCCLGFSLKVYLVEHKTICPNGTNGNFEELVQCPFCKIYLEKKEYLECHEIYCCKRNARQCVRPALDDHVTDEKTLSPATKKPKMSKITVCKYIGDLKNNTNTHYAIKMFRCGICYKRFKRKQSLKLHVENIHIAIKQRHSVRGYQQFNLKKYDYYCKECGFKTNNKACLEIHVKKIHLKQYDYNCAECEYKTNYKSKLEMHVRTKHLRELDYYCTECEYRTYQKLSLEIHVKSKHLKEYDYNCVECEYQTNRKFHLNNHVRVKHRKEYNYKCGKCEYKTYQKQYLEAHVKTKHRKEYDYSCTECGYKTNKKPDLKIHVRAKHLKGYGYNCMECEFKTKYKSSLDAHVKTKHRKEFDYNCTECGYKTNKKSQLEIHVRSKHLNEYDYTCAECEYQTNRKHYLEAHVKTKHLKEYDYNCAECEYQTNRKCHLEDHIKVKHLKEYDYNCSECGYKTNQKPHLKIHIRAKHLKGYDYNCTECEYKTTRKSVLELHVKSKHLKEYDYNCTDCEYQTNRKNHLNDHVRVKHLKIK